MKMNYLFKQDPGGTFDRSTVVGSRTNVAQVKSEIK